MEYKEIKINEIKEFKIGHYSDLENLTGCTVILPNKKAPCGIDVRGGGPANREGALLDPVASNDGVNAVVLSGGSAYGLDSMSGVMKYLEENKKGVKVGDFYVPIVVGSCIFDLGCGNGNIRPNAQNGYDACLDAQNNEVKNGNVGAGCGATVGKMYGASRSMKTGLGTYAIEYGKLKVGAIVSVNAIGDVYEMDSNNCLAGLLNASKDKIIDSEAEAIKLLQIKNFFTTNTTIACIITNANLDKTSMNKVAMLASNGIARTIRPVNTSMDGDTCYAMSCGKIKSSSDVVGTMAAYALAKAINVAVKETDEIKGYKSYKSFNK